MKFKSQLDAEIQEELKLIGELKVGSDEQKAAIDGATKLMDRAIEIKKLEVEIEQKEIDRENEMFYKDEELKSNKKERRARNLATAANIVIPVIVTVWGTIITLKFEESGTVTTNAGRRFIAKLFPKD